MKSKKGFAIARQFFLSQEMKGLIKEKNAFIVSMQIRKKIFFGTKNIKQRKNGRDFAKPLFRLNMWYVFEMAFQMDQGAFRFCKSCKSLNVCIFFNSIIRLNHSTISKILGKNKNFCPQVSSLNPIAIPNRVLLAEK